MNKLIYSIILSILILGSCSKTDDRDESIIIEYEMACGWCAGTTSLVIEGGRISYSKIIPCGTNKGTTSKNLTLRDIEWENLLKSYDQTRFLKLTINECGVCFDGCDERLKITKDGTTHEIKYLITSVPDEVDSLRAVLQGITLQFGNE